MISSGETLTSAKSGDALSRLTSSMVRVASTSVHTDTCGAEYADCTIAVEVALRTPLTGIDSTRPAACANGEATPLGAGGAGAASGVTVMVSSRTSGQSGVSILRKTLACDACFTTSSRVTSPASPEGVTAARSTPRSRASLRIGGFAMTPTDAVTGRSAGLRRREVTAPPVPYPTSTAPPPSAPPSAVSDCASPPPGASVCDSGADAAGAVSIVTIGVPTATVTPSSTSVSPTVPVNGEGSSTRDLAVSISTSTSLTCTASPGATFQVTISASVRPSPTSGRTKVCVLMSVLSRCTNSCTSVVCASVSPCPCRHCRS